MSIADRVLMRMEGAMCQGGFTFSEETGYSHDDRDEKLLCDLSDWTRFPCSELKLPLCPCTNWAYPGELAPDAVSFPGPSYFLIRRRHKTAPRTIQLPCGSATHPLGGL